MLRRTQCEPTELRDDDGKPVDIARLSLANGPALVLDAHERESLLLEELHHRERTKHPRVRPGGKRHNT